MAKYSELSAASALSGTEIVAVTQSGNSRRTTTQEIADLVTQPTTAVLLDTGGNHSLTIQLAEDMTANRALDIVVNNAAASLNITGAVVLPTGTAATLTGTQTLTNKTLAFLKTSVQALSGPGSVDLVTGATKLTTTGADAFTLADGAEGQMKIITMIVDGGDGILTPTNLGGGTTITFDAVGDSVLLVFLGTDWWVVSNNGCVVA